MNDVIIVTRHPGWAELQINREEKRNAMNRVARRSLLRVFAELRSSVKTIILTGTGNSFCAGIDLKELEEDRVQQIAGGGEEWIAVNLAIRSHPAIFIAAVNGLALGGGATLINVCDLAIASTSASIGCPEIGFATYPGMAGPAIQLSGITRKQAAWLVLTANRIDGTTAERWGMVNACVAPNELLPFARQLAEKIVGFDPVALAESKKALDCIPTEISTLPIAMNYGQMVNQVIRSKTGAQAEGAARFAAGVKNPGQGL